MAREKYHTAILKFGKLTMNLSQFLTEDFLRLPSEQSHLKNELKSKKILITGGTGFVGKWLLYYLIFINKTYNTDFEVLVLSRDPDKFLTNHPEIKQSNFIKWIKCHLEQPLELKFIPDFIIHMATDVCKTRQDSSTSSLEEITCGMRNLLRFTLENSKNKIKMLYLSSGAIYGKQPANLNFITENQQGILDPLCTDDFYGESKRICEMMGSIASRENINFNFVSARCFAFSGPFLPLKSTYALGNFVSNFLEKNNIEIKNEGQDVRSYLYGADLVYWLLKILLNGKNAQAYNVGSQDIITIEQLAHQIARINPELKVNTLNSSNEITQYVPSVHKAMSELNLKSNFSLQYAIERMIQFNQEYKNV